MEGQDACGKVDRILGCHDSLGSAFLLDHVQESLKRKGLLLGETGTASDLRRTLQSVRQNDARRYKDVACILARKRNKRLLSLDFSAFAQVKVLTSSNIQSFLLEGIATTAQSNPEAAPDGAMDPLTPEIVQQARRGSSPGSSVDNTSSPEAADPGALLSNDSGIPIRDPSIVNGASAMLVKETTIRSVSPSRGAQTRVQEQVTEQEVPANPSFSDKPTRKRKYLPKIRAENPRPRSRSRRVSVQSVNANLPAETSETTRSPSLLQMKSFARINQQRPKLKRPRPGSAAAVATFSGNSPAKCAPVCSAPQRPAAELVDQDSITQSAEFLRFLHESLFSGQTTKLCSAYRADSGCTCSSRSTDKEVDIDRSAAAGVTPTARGRIPVLLESERPEFTPVTSQWSPPSPLGMSTDPWSSFDDIVNSRDHCPGKSVRRALQFDDEQRMGVHLHFGQESRLGLAAAPDGGILQIPAADSEFTLPQVVTMDPGGGPGRGNELQVVAYDEAFKRMMVFQRRVPRQRRVRLKPKVNLDARTVRMFKTLTIKAASVGEGEEETVEEKTSWERSRQLWQHRALHFISIMRQVQGNRSFSRWKGSVVDSVGGAFLTQNVSDFLSSNAFMSLRARFPARSPEAKTAETTAKAVSPVEKQRPIPTNPVHPRPAEISTPRKGDHHQRQEESMTWDNPACLPSNVDWKWSARCRQPPSDLAALGNEAFRTGENFQGKGSPSRQDDVAHASNIFCTRNQRMTERTPQQLKSEEMAGMKESNRQAAASTNAAPVFEALTMLRHPNQPNASSCDEAFFRLTSNSTNLSPQQDVTLLLVLQSKSKDLPCAVLADGEFGHSKRKCHQQSSKLSWQGKRFAPGVLQTKFASAVAAEKVSSLTAVRQEENFDLVLLATLALRLVLGKELMAPEQLRLLLRDRLQRPECRKMKDLRSPEEEQQQQQLQLRLRPARALLRSSTDNYWYRRSVSFKLLAGEARASWEAGFVMKSLKAKWGPRRAAILGDAQYRRNPWTADCVDWEAVRKASVHEVAQVIKNRGMNNALAGRMKAFLDRVHRDQDDGSIDLEWIRWLPPEEAKAYLLSFRGVGIKSVECIRLLTLHHPSFPVDTNVGRILVRLGWVPLEPLPEETQLHLLELYPVQSQIQQYAWPRLCTLDQKTLYELHYQMITFGKVFCTKSKPNCNACPMRTECKHYASSYASAKLLLKGREEQSQMQAEAPALRGTEGSTESATLPNGRLCATTLPPCVPIIEEPCSPEPNTGEPCTSDIEELPSVFDTWSGGGISVTDVVDIGLSSSETGSTVTEDLCVNLVVSKTLSLELNRETEEVTNVLLPTTAVLEEVVTEGMGKRAINSVSMTNNETQVTALEADEEALQGGVPDDFQHLPSRELILLPPQASISPAPKLKSIQRLRTVHFVYELPDNHPLLFEMDKREPDDPCYYLLAIWSPDEVPATMPKIHDDESVNPFASCEEDCVEGPVQTTVRGTLLIPCKTAMRGWFPLNGTYFQVNEVFADHASSVQPIDVPRTLLWSLRRRFVYFSTAVSNLFKDMSQDEIQCCFQRGYVCLRAFDVATRQPRILASRLHQSGAKIVQARTPRKRQQRKNQSK